MLNFWRHLGIGEPVYLPLPTYRGNQEKSQKMGLAHCMTDTLLAYTLGAITTNCVYRLCRLAAVNTLAHLFSNRVIFFSCLH